MSNATPTQIGFQFQEYATIVLFCDMVRDISAVRIEGRFDDIELTMVDGTVVYSQVKYCNIDSQHKRARETFKEAVRTLSKDDNTNCSGLIYTSNIIRPFGKSTPLEDFGSHNRFVTYPDLSEESRHIVQQLIKQAGCDLNYEKLSFRVIGFHGSNLRTRCETVNDILARFLSKFGNMFVLDVDSILDLFIGLLRHNESDEDLDFVLSKKDIVWVIVNYLLSSTQTSYDDLDPAIRREVEVKYRNLISTYEEKMDFVSSVLFDFKKWSSDRIINAELTREFVCSNWSKYCDLLEDDFMDYDTKRAVLTILLTNVLSLRGFIPKMKEVTGIVD